uniref:Rab proteins geranylgeranyltransferase component A n=1 Tax=Amphiprion percula TaxID=161767 RepID=A0A3P8RYE9_AMPPE
MAAEDLPSEFDVVILGTGLAESVVAAACSRVGQRVLHLDRRSYYAANWASFTFNGLLSWIQQHQVKEVQDWSGLLEEGEELIYLSNSDPASIRNLQVFCYTSEEDEEEEAVSPGPSETTEEEAVKETSETESADSKDEEGNHQVRRNFNTPAAHHLPAINTHFMSVQSQAVHTQGEEPEADQPCPSAAPSQSQPTRKKISYAQLVKEGRRFNIDLVSKLMYSRGSLVDLLIKSNVSRYAEFKNVTRILTYRHGNVEQVPCSRADVFASRQLSVVEKRKLMRFLTSCVEEMEEHQAYSGRPYLEFLRNQQLGDNLQHFLLHSIAMVTEDTPTEEGLASTRHFLRCLGRYGNTPFLFPVYGLGEIPQCFCRMCAVFGGIYCLRHSLLCLLLDMSSNRYTSSQCGVSCEDVTCSDPIGRSPCCLCLYRFVSRAVLITDSSVLPSDSEQQVSVVTVPPIAAGCPAVRMVELSPSTMTCVPGTHLVHLTCQSVGSAYEDLSPVVTRMFHTPESPDRGSRPSVLWCLYFNMADGWGVEPEGHDLPSNVFLCSGPDAALGHDHAVRQAESIFQKILPEEDFCPPAPNPEDIIYDGDNSSSSTAGGLEEPEEERQEEPEEEHQEEKQLLEEASPPAEE